MKAALLSSVAALFLVAACDTRNGTEAPAPDNTANNARDQDTNAKTPMDQSNESKDIEISAEIRKAIVDDTAMSTNARNIKIITEDGAVTLRGVVDSEAEKQAIEDKAKAVPGVVSVDNQLEVKTP